MHTPEAISFLAISLASSGAWEISAGASEAYILHMLSFSSQSRVQFLHLTTPLHHFNESGGHHTPLKNGQFQKISMHHDGWLFGIPRARRGVTLTLSL